MKKKIFIALICFSLVGCKEVGNYLINGLVESTISKQLPDHMQKIQKNQWEIDNAHKFFVYISSRISLSNNNKPLLTSDENYIKFFKSNFNYD